MRHSVRTSLVELVPRVAGAPLADRRQPRLRPTLRAADAIILERARPAGGELPIEALVTATRRARWAHDLTGEQSRVLELVRRRPVALVEIGAALAAPIAAARVVVRDLAAAGYLLVHTPPPVGIDGRPSPAVLARLLEGLRDG